MSPPEPAQLPAPLVLVVDDEPQLRRFLRATLPAHGYRVVEAETAAQALQEAASRGPGVGRLPDG